MRLWNEWGLHAAVALAPDGEGAGGDGGSGGGEGGGADPTGGTGGDGSGGGAWYSGLELADEDRQFIETKGYKAPGELVRAYREAERYQGQSIALPGEDAKPEDWGKIWNRLGRPEAPDGYRFEDVDEAKLDEAGKAALDWFRETAHAAGLTAKQAAALRQANVDRLAKQQETAELARRTANEEAVAALKQEWGEKYDGNTELARRAVRSLGLSMDEIDALDGALGHNMAITRALHRIAPALQKAQLLEGGPHTGQGGGDLGIGKEEAERKIAAVQADAQHPYFNPDHPGHKAAVQQMREWFEAVHGTEPADRHVA